MMKVKRPFFFDETIKSVKYLNMLQGKFYAFNNRCDKRIMIFIQFGAPPNWALAVGSSPEVDGA